MKSVPTFSTAAKPSHDQIAATAYHLFLENGCRHGNDLSDWFRAEQLLVSQLSAGAIAMADTPSTSARKDPVRSEPSRTASRSTPWRANRHTMAKRMAA